MPGMGRLSGLDALRGIAAASVLGFHIAANTVGQGSTDAYLGVDFFFLLSGFVMARTYETKLSEGMSPAHFLALRYARLWPVMACSMALGVPFVFGAFGFNWGTIVAVALNFALLPSFSNGCAFITNFPAWSIFFELAANLFHGLVIWRVRTRLLLFAVAALLAIFAAHGLGDRPLNVGMDSGNFLAGFRRVLLTYLLGVWLYRSFGETPPIKVPAWLALGLMPAIFFATWAFNANPGVLDLIFAVLVGPVVLLGGLTLKPGPALLWLGRISFPLYAVHSPIIALLVLYKLPVLLALPLALVAATALERVPSSKFGRSRAVAGQATV